MTDYSFNDDYDVDGMSFAGFTDYQDFTGTTDKAGTDLNTVLGLLGEGGEIAEKVKKLTRSANDTYPHGTDAVKFGSFPSEARAELAKEVGDVLWYASRLAARLGYDLGDIARMNVEKLSSRKVRGVLHGKGDNR